MHFQYESLPDKEASNIFLSTFFEAYTAFLKQNFGEDVTTENGPDFSTALKFRACADRLHMPYKEFWEVACLRFGRLEGKNYKTLFNMPDQIKLFVRDSAFDKVIFAEADCKIDYTGTPEQDAFFDWMIRFHETACDEPLGWLLRKARLGYIPPAYMSKRRGENVTVKALVENILSSKRQEVAEQEIRQERDEDLYDINKCLEVVRGVEKELGWEIKHLYMDHEGYDQREIFQIIDIDLSRDYSLEHAKMYAQVAHMSGREYGREAVVEARHALLIDFEIRFGEMEQRVWHMKQYEADGTVFELPIERLCRAKKEPEEVCQAALITETETQPEPEEKPDAVMRAALVKEDGKKTLVWSGIAEEKDGRGFQTVMHGQVGGKIQKSKPKEIFPKNIGKSNETTPFQQAWLETRAMAQKKVDNGYRPIYNSDGKNPFQMPELPHLRPMLAKSYEPDPGASNGFKTVFLQPKLDGVRCLARVEIDKDSNREGVLLSREGKRFTVPVHIMKEIAEATWMEPGLVLDGEIYADGMTFQEIISAVKKENQNTAKLKLHIYDMMWFEDPAFQGKPESVDFAGRLVYFDALPLRSDSSIAKVETVRVDYDIDFISKYHDTCTARGYEGAILRLPGKGYELGKRSKNLLKIKVFTDLEFKIVGGFSETGKDAGCVVFECVTEAGQAFNVRPKGDVAYRKQLLESLEEHIGKDLTVRFQGLTDAGIPRFPVGIAVRDYE